ncbi:MAG: DUF4129 domain-containing protein [Bacteroidota bacterium]
MPKHNVFPIQLPSAAVRLLLLTALLALPILLQAQDYYEEYTAPNPKEDYFNSSIQVNKLDQSKWSEVVKDINYNEDTPDEDVDIDEDEDDGTLGESGGPQERNYNRRESSDLSSGWALFFKILFILLIIVVVAVLAYFLIGESITRPKSKSFTPGDSAIRLEEVEENIHESDLDDFIRQALSQGNYPVAIRLYYLAVIKELSLNKKIKWKRDKTNRDYQNELRDGAFFQPFRQATRIFERVWYGNGQLDRNSFDELEPIFRKLIDTVKTS